MWKDRIRPSRAAPDLRLGITVPEDRHLPELSVWENLDIARRAGVNGKITWRRTRYSRSSRPQIRDRRGGVLSGANSKCLRSPAR